MCLPYLMCLAKQAKLAPAAQWLLHPLSLGHSSVSHPDLATSAIILYSFTSFDGTHTIIRVLQQAWIVVLTRFLPSNALYVTLAIFIQASSALQLACRSCSTDPAPNSRTGMAADLAVVVVEVTSSVDENLEMTILAMVSERYGSTITPPIPF